MAFAHTSTCPSYAHSQPLHRYTVQYFVWFFSFLPLALARLPLQQRPRFLAPSLIIAGEQLHCTLNPNPGVTRDVAAVAAWAAAQGGWLSQAYLLEFEGRASHYTVRLLRCMTAACT